MQKDSFQVIKEVILGSLPFHGSFLFHSRLRYKREMFSLCLLPVVTLGLGTVTKCFVQKAYFLHVIKLRAFPFSHAVRAPQVLLQKHSMFGDDWGVSDLPRKQQGAGRRK